MTLAPQPGAEPADSCAVPADPRQIGDRFGDPDTIAADMSGIFYCGDNLEILDELRKVPAESVDLIYLDPPFNSQRTFNVVYKGSQAQEFAFKDYWSWEEAAPTFARLVDSSEAPPRLRSLLRGLYDLLKDDDSDLLAYLSMMAPRIAALRRVLKPTGSLYLHCDPTASHYLKLILDALFGSENFRNEVIWKRFSAKNDANRFGRGHDVLLFYTCGKNFTWNAQHGPFEDDYVEQNYRYTEKDTGRRYRRGDLTAHKPGGDVDYEWHGARPYKGRHWAYSRENMDKMLADGRIEFRSTGMPVYKRYLDEQPGVPLQDIWIDVRLHAGSNERIGYPTQKPVALLERIIKASSNQGDLVLDPFCGCGTTIEACERLGRRWIGIDIASKAVEVTEGRFAKLEIEPPAIVWMPPDMDAAAALAKRSGTKFEEWARQKIRAVKRRKRDRGIDGEAFFRDGDRTVHVLVSVKSGKLNPAMVRELRGTIEREKAPIGVLLTMLDPSKEMRREATHAGFLSLPDGSQVPRLQLLTIEQVFNGEGIRAPGANVTPMPEPIIPTGVPQNQEQLSLRLDPVKPPVKTKKAPRRSDPPEASEGDEPKPKRQSGRPAS